MKRKSASNRTAIGLVAVSTKEQVGDDKVSLSQQDAEIQAWCQREGYHLSEILVIPGHSRNYRSVEAMNRAMLKDGIDAVDRFIRHVEARDFNVLVCRNLDRLGRSQGIISQMVEMVIEDAHAKIYAYAPGAGGWLDDVNAAMHIAIAGFMAATHKKGLAAMRRDGMNKRMERGLSPNRPPISHMYIRDSMGQAVKMVVDERQRPLLNLMRDLLLSNVSFSAFPLELERRGYVNPYSGKRWGSEYFARFFYRADVWGNMVKRDSRIEPDKHAIHGPYCLTPDVPAPPGIEMLWGTHEAAWTGEDAKRMQVNLLTMRPLFKGNARPAKRRMFSQLLVCDACNHVMIFHNTARRKATYYRCKLAASPNTRDRCDDRKRIRVKDIRVWIDAFLRKLLELDTPGAFLDTFAPDKVDYAGQLAALQTALAGVEGEASKLIVDQSKAPPELSRLYDERLQVLANQIRALESQLEQTRAAASKVVLFDPKPVLAQLDMDTFWEQDETLINDILHEIFGSLRLFVRHGEIVRLALYDRPPKLY